MSDKKTAEVLIVGGGLLGLLTARYFVQAGVSVMLLEKNRCCREASWAGAGILSAMSPWTYSETVNQLILQSQQMYPTLCEQLYVETDIDPQFYASGLLFIDLQDVQRALAWCEKQRQTIYPVDLVADYGSICAPQGCDTGYLMPELASVRNPALGEALLASLRQHRHFSLFENTAVEEISVTAQLNTLKAAGRIFSFDKILFCSGAWTTELLKNFSLPAISPVKGEMLLFKTEQAMVPHMLMYQGRYIVPRRDGYLLVGSTQQRVGFDKSLSSENRESLLEFACGLLPELKKKPLVKHWSGLRPASDNGEPVMMKIPDINNAYVCSGHFRNGIAMAPAAAKSMFELMLAD